jgi:hypothetical protein
LKRDIFTRMSSQYLKIERLILLFITYFFQTLKT